MNQSLPIEENVTKNRRKKKREESSSSSFRKESEGKEETKNFEGQDSSMAEISFKITKSRHQKKQ